MDQLLSVALLFFFLTVGMISYRARLAPPPNVVDAIARGTLGVLLLSMGLRLGQSGAIVARLPEIGALATATALATTAGTVLALLAAGPLLRRLERSSARRTGTLVSDQAEPSESGVVIPATTRSDFFSHFRGPLGLLVVVVAAFLLGLLLPAIPILSSGVLTNWTLYVLLTLIGMQMAASQIDFGSLLLRPATAIVPLGTVVGSLIGALAVGLLFDLAPGKSFALGAGFGWYSLSGVLITDLGDPLLGSTAFLANLLRETLALVAIPFLASTGRWELSIGAGGATSMDVTLPLIERCCGPQSVPLSIAHGLTLSLLVPVLVPLFFGMG
ncbi:MAG: LysO family transporter [Pirellulaceae bacterium]